MTELLDILANPAFWIATLRVATPLILGTLGVLLCERAGVLNLGIEGIMVAGAFTGWLTVYAGHGLWTGVLVAARVAVASAAAAAARTAAPAKNSSRPRPLWARLCSSRSPAPIRS